MKLLITVEGRQYEVEVEILEEHQPERPLEHSDAHGLTPTLTPSPAPAPPPNPGTASEVKSPTAGNVVSLNVSPGEQVVPNDPLLVIEAMKMESSIVSPIGGTVREVLVKPGDAVAADQVLVRF